MTLISKTQSLINSGVPISIPFLQRKFGLSFENAKIIYEHFFPNEDLRKGREKVIEFLQIIEKNDLRKDFDILDNERRDEKSKIQKEYLNTDHGRSIFRKAWAKRRARMKNASVDLTEEEELQILLFYSLCPKGHHVDHKIPLSKGGKHTLSNLQYLLASDNLKKSAKIVPVNNDCYEKVLEIFFEIKNWIQENIETPVEDIMKKFGVGKRYASKIFNEVKKEIEKMKPKKPRTYYFQEYWNKKRQEKNV